MTAKELIRVGEKLRVGRYASLVAGVLVAGMLVAGMLFAGM